MRIMFCLMPDIFAYGRVGNTVSNGRCDESQIFARCTVCRRTNAIDQVGARQILTPSTLITLGLCRRANLVPYFNEQCDKPNQG